MPLYTYECPEHGCFDVEFSLKDELPLTVECGMCVWPAKRIYSVPQLAPVMHEHYNPSAGGLVSSHRGHADALKRKSDEATERTGIEHNFQPASLDEISSSFDRSKDPGRE